MDHCPACGARRCDCSNSRPLAFVYAVIDRELRHLEETEVALLRQIDRLPLEDREDRVALKDLARRYRVRYMAVIDLKESLEQAVEHFSGGPPTPPSMTIEQFDRPAAASPELSVIPPRGTPSAQPRSETDSPPSR